MNFVLNFSWFFLTRILSCFVLSWDFWKIDFLDLSWTEIFDYSKFSSCLASQMTVSIISCLEFQDFVSVSNCLVSRKTCLDPPLKCTTSRIDLTFRWKQPTPPDWPIQLSIFLDRLSPYEWDFSEPWKESDEKEFDMNLHNCFWHNWGSLMQQGSDLAPRYRVLCHRPWETISTMGLP